ncbi:MAG: hypothetical protein K5893_09325 [Prevotella sp.]|nr:hypothetical protein [Prevotella sp.]
MNKNNKRILYYVLAGVATVAVLAGIAVGCLNKKPVIGGGGRQLGVTEVIDSFVSVMPQGSKVVARFNDDRHCIYYLNSGHLMKFNAVSKMLDEVNPSTMIDDVSVYYNDRDTVSGVLEAELTEDEKFIVMRVVTERNERFPEMTEYGSFKLNTESMNLLPYKWTPKKKVADNANQDSLRRAWAAYQRRQASKAESSEPAETAPATPQPVETPLEEQPSAAPAPAPAPTPAPAPAAAPASGE